MALRLTAQVSINDVQRFAVVLKGVEIISNLLVRYDIYTTLYLNDNAKSTDEMKRRMVELYTSVLSFLAKAKRYYTRSTPSECHFCEQYFARPVKRVESQTLMKKLIEGDPQSVL